MKKSHNFKTSNICDITLWDSNLSKAFFFLQLLFKISYLDYKCDGDRDFFIKFSLIAIPKNSIRVERNKVRLRKKPLCKEKVS